MSGNSASIIISLIGVIVSILAAVFIAGVGVGGIKGDLKAISDRLSRIEGMFTLQLKDHDRP